MLNLCRRARLGNRRSEQAGPQCNQVGQGLGHKWAPPRCRPRRASNCTSCPASSISRSMASPVSPKFSLRRQSCRQVAAVRRWRRTEWHRASRAPPRSPGALPTARLKTGPRAELSSVHNPVGAGSGQGRGVGLANGRNDHRHDLAAGCRGQSPGLAQHLESNVGQTFPGVLSHHPDAAVRCAGVTGQRFCRDCRSVGGSQLG